MYLWQIVEVLGTCARWASDIWIGHTFFLPPSQSSAERLASYPFIDLNLYTNSNPKYPAQYKKVQNNSDCLPHIISISCAVVTMATKLEDGLYFRNELPENHLFNPPSICNYLEILEEELPDPEALLWRQGGQFATEALDTFTLFPKLPPELRFKIWYVIFTFCYALSADNLLLI